MTVLPKEDACKDKEDYDDPVFEWKFSEYFPEERIHVICNECGQVVEHRFGMLVGVRTVCIWNFDGVVLVTECTERS